MNAYCLQLNLKNVFFFLFYTFNSTFTKITPETKENFEKSYKYTVLCETYRICKAFDHYIPYLSLPAFGLALMYFLDQKNDIHVSNIMIASIFPLIIGGSSFLIQKMVIKYVKKYDLSERNIEIKTGSFVFH